MISEKFVYLDYAATTPLDERVLEAMLPYLSESFGNPSSVHRIGQEAEAAIEEARVLIASRISALPEEIVFTSGGTESDNLALRGVSLARRAQKGANHILISPVEHPAVAATARQLNDHFGFTVEKLPVDQFGTVSPEDVRRRLRDTTALVSVIYANNEIGTINPVREIAAICRDRNIPLHTDAVQAAAHLPMDVEEDCIDLLSIGAHKFGGPKGVGALYVRKGTPILPLQTGGSQEIGRRAGTSNTAYITGMAKAFDLAQRSLSERSEHVQALRDLIITTVLEEIPGVRLTGHPIRRLPNHASFVFTGLDGNQLLVLLDERGYACSSGSACKTGSPKPSEVLEAVGLSPEWTLGSLRVTLGMATTRKQVESFLTILPETVAAARRLSSRRLNAG